MIDFSKTEEQSPRTKEFYKLKAQYLEKFGEPFVLDIGTYSPTWEEAIRDIKACIATGKPQVIPDYNPDYTY